MALCDNCKSMIREYDEFRSMYDDFVDEKITKQKHFCPMYDDAIPDSIFYGNAECPYYLPERTDRS